MRIARWLSAISLLLLSGCYRSWPQVEQFAGEISCTDSRAAVIRLADHYQAEIFGDPQAELLQFQKMADAVLVQFDRQQQIVLVAVHRADIRFLGTYRQLASPEVITRCRP